MTTDAPLYGITASTGVVGSRVLAALRKSSVPESQIRCIVRKGTEKNLDELKAAGFESVKFVDFLDVETVTKALEGCTVVYLNSPPSLDALAMRENMARACSIVKPRHVILLGEATGINFYGHGKYWDDHCAGEHAIQKTGLPFTVLHPALFSEGFSTHFGNPQTIKAGDFFSRVGTTPVAFTSIDDVAEVAVKVMLEGPRKHAFKKYNLVSETLTGEQAAAKISLALGRTIEYRPITVEEFCQGMKDAGLPQGFINGYSRIMDLFEDGYFDYDDRGQLDELLGRRSMSLTETILGFKDLLDPDTKLERETNK